ncbi:MAG: zinc ribbon domain-containing protein, partial [Candidatus Omnitrophica bacterium]|nr:zinc ribbon domain-containing protein [Candidatus Omnitrophota bacterium]
MPTYEYECSKCGFKFERFQSMSDKPVAKCPECSGKVKRLIGKGSGIIFKGSGFYATDHKKQHNPSCPAKGGSCPNSACSNGAK